MTVSYDDPHFDYQKYWQERKYEDQAERKALLRLLKLVPFRETVLDLGGGFGRLTSTYAPLFKKCFLVDPSEKLLNQAKKISKSYPNLFIIKGVAEKIPIKSNFLDVVISIRLFHHLKNCTKVIKEIFRVLKPGGFLILEFANKIHFKNIIKAFFRRDFQFLFNQKPLWVGKNKEVTFLSYHPNQIKSLLNSSGFKIIKVISVSNFRHPLIKKIVPLSLLIKLESLFSFSSSYLPFIQFWGPSIFILAQKKK